MEQQRTQNMNQSAEQLTDTARQSFQMLADRTVSLQESNLRLTQTFFQNFMQQLQSQAVQKHGQQQREALETISNEATNAYSAFLDSALSFYQETLNTASQVAQNNMQQAAQVTQQGLQSWPGLKQATMEAANQSSKQGRDPAVLEYTGSDRMAAIQLIDELLNQDPSYDEETWPEIAEALDRDRLSDRKLFVD